MTAQRPAPAAAPGSPPAFGSPRPGGRRPGRQLAALGFDIGAPIGAYYLLRGCGMTNLPALAAAAVLPALGAVYTLIVRRRADGVALLVLATMAASIAVSAIARQPRFLLAKDGLITGVWGLWFIATVRARRPAAFTFARPLMESLPIYAARSWDALWETEPSFRRIWRVSTVLWGTGMLIDAAIRVVISYTLPISVVPGLGGALWPVTFLALQVVTNIYHQIAGLNRLLGARWQQARHDPGRRVHEGPHHTSGGPGI
jgi:hypothetical protein